MAQERMIYDVLDKPSLKEIILFALQQVLAIIAATISVPKILGLAMNIPAAIFGAGIGTLVYVLLTKRRSPVILSSNFSFLSAIANAALFGYCGIAIGSVFAGLVYIVLAIVVHFVGTNWINKIMPVAVIGPVVACIGFTLSPNAITHSLTADGAVAALNAIELKANNNIGSYNLLALLCALVCAIVIVIVSTQKKKKQLALIPFIIGIIAGYALAIVFTIFGNVFDVNYLKIVDFKPLVSNFVTDDGSFVGIRAIFNLPNFVVVEAIKELVNGHVSDALLKAYPEAHVITGIGILEIAIAYIPVAFVGFAEHIADHKNLSFIIGRDLLNDEPGLCRTLLGDGVGSIASTLFGFCPNTTYGESIACVASTKNASSITTIVSSMFCMLIAFISPLAAFFQTIPTCIIGGACIVLYGFIALSGFKMIQELDFDVKSNFFTVSMIMIIAIGGLIVRIPYQFDGNVMTKYIEISSIASALILGVIIYKILVSIEKKQTSISK